MTIQIKMLHEIASHARAMADLMQAIADDCSDQLAARLAAGESEEAIANELYEKTVADRKAAKPSATADLKPYNGPTPFDEPKQPESDTSQMTNTSMTMEEFRAFVAKRSTPENRAKIKAILERHGVKKVTELPQSEYPAVMKEVAEL